VARHGSAVLSHGLCSLVVWFIESGPGRRSQIRNSKVLKSKDRLRVKVSEAMSCWWFDKGDSSSSARPALPKLGRTLIDLLVRSGGF